MKAIDYGKYGGPEVLRFREIKKPIPKKNEILIKVYATSITRGDIRLRKADPFMARLYNGLFRPKKVNVLGFELAGVVEEIGVDVDKYKVGDEVFAFCGFGFGAYAQYKCIQIDGDFKNGTVAIKPAKLTFEQAAVIPTGGLTALSLVRKANIKRGQKVLIYGASGSVGTFAVQLAKYYGAIVTGVCSTTNIDLVKSIGANRVIDYTKEDFTSINNTYDFVLDAVGKITAKKCKNILTKKGTYASVHFSPPNRCDDMEYLRKLIETDNLRPVIDRQYHWSEIVKGHEYVEKGHKKGNVVLSVDGEISENEI